MQTDSALGNTPFKDWLNLVSCFEAERTDTARNASRTIGYKADPRVDMTVTEPKL